MDIQRERDTPPTGALGETEWTFAMGPQALVRENLDETIAAEHSPHDQPNDTEYERAKSFIAKVVKPFIQQRRGASLSNQALPKTYKYPIDLDSHNMTEEQWIPFSLCMRQSRKRRRAIAQGSTCEPMRIILNGEGGAGKSWLIRHIVKDVHKVWGDVHTSIRHSKRVLLMAHHGTAAFNIKGVTICSALGLGASTGGFNNSYITLESTKTGLSTLRALQDKYKDVQLVIVDEYSVISCAMLHWIDQRMREIWPHCRHLQFGGRDLVLAGDIGQLPSVLPASLATPVSQLKSPTQTLGRQLWTSIDIVCTLNSQKRGSEDPEWYDALKRLRSMDENDDDLRLFNTRHKAQDDMPIWTSSATHIAYRNIDVDAANEQCLQRSARDVHQIRSTHSVLPNRRAGDVCQPLDEELVRIALDAANEPNPTHDRVIPREIKLAVGVPVTLTHNLAQSAGLCNGTKAIVHGFIFASDSPLPVVLIQVQDKYLGPSFASNVPDVVPVAPQVLSWLSRSKHIRTTRIGLPLRLAFAMTIHKVQGLTCSKLVFNPAAIPTSTFAYVALSRVRRREDAVLTQSLTAIKTSIQLKTKELRHSEWARLEALNSLLRARTPLLVAEMQTLARLENEHS